MIPEWTMQDRMAKALDVANVAVSEMADELGVSRNTVSNYIHNRTSPSRSVLRVWALRTGVPFGWLTGGPESGTTETVTPRYPEPLAA